MPLAIRELTCADLPALAALLVEVTNQHAEAMPFRYRTITADADINALLQGLLDDDEVVGFGAELTGQLVGYIVGRVAVAPSTPLHVPCRWLTINTVVVAAACRRQGIGTALMDAVQVWAEGQDLAYVELSVAEFNTAAIALYAQLGYTTVMRRMVRALPHQAG
jgi:ribosomal protein S18 acetylase RimI-like enzyme